MQSLEERKQEFREQLKIDFAPKRRKKFQLFIDEPKYQSTAAVIRNYSSKNWPGEELKVKSRSQMILGIFLVVAPLVACISTFKEKNYISWFFFSIFFCYGIKIIFDSINLKTALLVNSKGIYYYQWLEYIKWEDIVATYVQERYEGSATYTYTNYWLLVFYYDKKNGLFEKKAIRLEDLQTDITELSYFVEYLKMKAGFPTQTGYY